MGAFYGCQITDIILSYLSDRNQQIIQSFFYSECNAIHPEVFCAADGDSSDPVSVSFNADTLDIGGSKAADWGFIFYLA